MLDLTVDHYRSGWDAVLSRRKRRTKRRARRAGAARRPGLVPVQIRPRPFPNPHKKSTRPTRLPRRLTELRRFRPDPRNLLASARKISCFDEGRNTDSCRPRDAIRELARLDLFQAVLRTGSRIVLSSTWRLHVKYRNKLVKRLESAGVDRCLIIDDTPQLPFDLRCRGGHSASPSTTGPARSRRGWPRRGAPRPQVGGHRRGRGRCAPCVLLPPLRRRRRAMRRPSGGGAQR